MQHNGEEKICNTQRMEVANSSNSGTFTVFK